MDAELPVHGGDRMRFRDCYGEGEWLDMSANVNPAGPTPAVLRALRKALGDPHLLIDYPSGRERLLRARIARRHDIAESRVCIANGSAALIEAFVRARRPRRCVLPVPAFSEYERALRSEGCEIVPHFLYARNGFVADIEALHAQALAVSADLLIITNPHNPSGSLISRQDLRLLMQYAAKSNISLFIDEAFIDYAPEESCITDLDSDAETFVLRSLTKFHGIPGLRVGYGFSSSDATAAAINTALPSWPITSLAIEGAIAALDTPPSVTHRFVIRNERARTRLQQKLERLSCDVTASHANFLLVRVNMQASTLTRELAESDRIIVRDCSSYMFAEPGEYIRIAVRSEAENARVVAALSRILQPAFVAKECEQ